MAVTEHKQHCMRNNPPNTYSSFDKVQTVSTQSIMLFLWESRDMLEIEEQNKR